MKQLIFASLLILSSGIVGASEPVGKVILSFGQNYAVDAAGEERLLKRQAELYADDLLKTAAKGRLQVRFSDGSRLSLKPKTEFRIAEYSFDAANPEDGKALYKLLKGGMRTISGKIGKVNKENYKLETVVATIGIRGTHYGTEFTPSGLYTETLDGKVVVETDEGVVEVSAGESVSVNARTGGMTKGKATGQTSQGEGDSEESSEEGNSEEGSSEENNTDENTGDESSEEEGASESDESGDTTTDGSSSNSDDNAGTASENVDGASEGNGSTSTDSGTETSISLGSTTGTAGGTTGGTAPATDPTTGSTQPPLSSPDPTGNGTAAPQGGMALIAFIEDDPTQGKRESSGSVFVDDNSAMTIDSTSGQDRLTGILYVDTKPSSTDICNPCTMTAPVDQTLIKDAGTQDVGGTKLSWGRWEKGSYTVIENGTTQKTLSDFHFMYSDRTTPNSVIAAKTGSYVYEFKVGNPVTIPQFEDGATGELVDLTLGSTLGASVRGSEGEGTYLQVDWGSQTITEVGVKVLERNASNNVINTFELQELTAGGTSLSNVLNGGELKLTGSCYGTRCGTSTTLDGRMNVEFVGSNAEGAAISYGASGSAAGTTEKDVSVVGTALLTERPAGS